MATRPPLPRTGAFNPDDYDVVFSGADSLTPLVEGLGSSLAGAAYPVNRSVKIRG